MSQREPFIVDCESCEMRVATDDLEEALTFAVKHKQHTGHTLNWERCALVNGVVTIPERTRWQVTCETCDIKRLFDTKSAAQSFYEEHDLYAGHTPNEPEQVELPEMGELDSSDIRAVLNYCFEAAPSIETIPTNAIIEAFEEAGIGQERTAKELARAIKHNEFYHQGEGLLAR